MVAAWEKYLAANLAGMMGGQKIHHRAAALVVKYLDKKYALTPVMANVQIDSPADLNDSELVPSAYLAAMSQMWDRMGIHSGRTRSEAQVSRALMELAVYAYLHMPVELIVASKQIAAQSVGITWESQGGWSGLRDEFLATMPEASRAQLSTDFDAVSRNANVRGFYTKEFQAWANRAGLYNGPADGNWNSGWELLWNNLSPVSATHMSSMTDVQAVTAKMVATGAPSTSSFNALAAAMTRDLWLEEHPTSVVRVTVPDKPDEEVVPVTPPGTVQQPSTGQALVRITPVEESKTKWPTIAAFGLGALAIGFLATRS